nr:unnamed protein product [Callosobruchus chinensis]
MLDAPAGLHLTPRQSFFVHQEPLFPGCSGSGEWTTW